MTKIREGEVRVFSELYNNAYGRFYGGKMKKTIMILLVLILILGISLFAGCRGGNNEDSPAPDAGSITDSEPAADDEAAADAGLNADEARGIAQAWLNEHPIREPNILERGHERGLFDGEEYFEFFLDSHEMYWFSILVNIQTGELLSRVVSDGEVSTEEIEPLDDYYQRYFAVG